MKLARYMGQGTIEICDEVMPECPTDGLLAQTEACGLCSGELMDWYMEGKIPHVLGHEVSAKVIESQSEAFPVGSRIVPHHHAPCMQCQLCHEGLFVQCQTWRKTKLNPGGMAQYFAVARENLTDCHLANDILPINAALTEPLACVQKAIHQTGIRNKIHQKPKIAVIGLGTMGMLHLFSLQTEFPSNELIGYEVNPLRLQHAQSLKYIAKEPCEASEADFVFVCPGAQSAMDLATKIIRPGGTILLFAPFTPGLNINIPINNLYFKDVSLVTSYSAGPPDMTNALRHIREGGFTASIAVSDFISLEELPDAYQAMKTGKLLKPMVVF